MAGSSSSSQTIYYVPETTSGTIPSSPAFKNVPSDPGFSLNPDRVITEQFANRGKGSRTGMARTRYAPSGSFTGGLIYGVFDTFLESLFQSTWTSNVLKNGTTLSSMSFQTGSPAGAGSATIDYDRYRGVQVTGGGLNLTSDSEAKFNFDMLGTGNDATSATALTGATLTADTETTVIGTGSQLGTISFGSFTMDCMQSLVVDFGKSGADIQPRIGSDDGCGITPGVFNPVLNASFYVEAGYLALRNAARSGTNFVCTLPLGNITGKKYSLVFPACEMTETNLDASDNSPLFHNVTILPKYDDTEACIVKLTRAVV